MMMLSKNVYVVIAISNTHCLVSQTSKVGMSIADLEHTDVFRPHSAPRTTIRC